MGRPSERPRRRSEITAAFARVLASRGHAGASVAAIAEAAGVSAGLIHHHFRDKADLFGSLLDHLSARFRQRSGRGEAAEAWIDGALGLGPGADPVEARAWVGLIAEAMREPHLLARLRRRVGGELAALEAGGCSREQAAAVLSLTVGALVLGALGTDLPAGFAAPAAHRLMRAG